MCGWNLARRNMITHSTPISSSTFPIYESIVNTNRFTSVDSDTHECAIWLQLRQDREYYEMDGRVGVWHKSLFSIGASTNRQGIGCRSRKRGKSWDWRDLVRKLLLSGLFGREYHSTVCYKIKSGWFERKGWILFLSLSLCVKGERGRGEIDYTMVSHKRVSSKRTVEWNRIDRIPLSIPCCWIENLVLKIVGW